MSAVTRQRPRPRGGRGLVVLAFAFTLALAASVPGDASPPMCHRDDAAMFVRADAIVAAEVLQSRRDDRPEVLRLEARYRVLETFKGALKKGQRLVVRRSCIDRPVPRELWAYPADDYCQGGAGLRLTGLNPVTGAPLSNVPGKGWLLFLHRDGGDWEEVSRTGFFPGCSADESALSAGQRRGLERLREWSRR